MYWALTVPGSKYERKPKNKLAGWVLSESRDLMRQPMLSGSRLFSRQVRSTYPSNPHYAIRRSARYLYTSGAYGALLVLLEGRGSGEGGAKKLC